MQLYVIASIILVKLYIRIRADVLFNIFIRIRGCQYYDIRIQIYIRGCPRFDIRSIPNTNIREHFCARSATTLSTFTNVVCPGSIVLKQVNGRCGYHTFIQY